MPGMQWMVAASMVVLQMVLFVVANTNSCTMIHQPRHPEGLKKFRVIK